jgi:hypothetical protein
MLGQYSTKKKQKEYLEEYEEGERDESKKEGREKRKKGEKKIGREKEKRMDCSSPFFLSSSVPLLLVSLKTRDLYSGISI